MAALRKAPSAATGVLAALGAVAVLLLAGCSEEAEGLPDACSGRPGAILTALDQAPGPVLLEDGTPLSRCVSAARTNADLQSLGLTFVAVADTLRARAASDPDAALRLGYLAGAVSSGAVRSSGSIAMQLARRVEQVATLEEGSGAAAQRALARGRRAGARSG